MGERVVVIDDELADLLREHLPRIADAIDRAAQPTAGHLTAGMTVVEVADELRVSVDTVEAMVARGEMHAARFGRRIVIPRTEVDRLLSIPSAEQARPMRRVG